MVVRKWEPNRYEQEYNEIQKDLEVQEELDRIKQGDYEEKEEYYDKFQELN